MRFADDTTLLCTSKEELLALLKKVKEASKSQNLLLNTQKTKIMVLDKSRERKEDFVLDGENIEEVESFVYLGSLINIKGSSAQEIRRRLAMGRGAVQNMVSIWKSRGMSLGLKVRFLRATAFPIAIYGCESWAMTSGDKKRVDAFELWCYRRRLRVSWVERKTNKWVLEKIGVCSDVEKEYGGEEDEVLWPHRPEERYGEKVDAREGGRQAEKGQTNNGPGSRI